jgi:predicted outer membrane protein
VDVQPHRWRNSKQLLGIIIVVGALGAAPASAQSADQPFAREAAMGGMAELELGTLAKAKASSADVKQFEDRMVTDHRKANARSASSLPPFAQR